MNLTLAAPATTTTTTQSVLHFMEPTCALAHVNSVTVLCHRSLLSHCRAVYVPLTNIARKPDADYFMIQV